MEILLNFLGVSIVIIVFGIVYCAIYAFRVRTNMKYDKLHDLINSYDDRFNNDLEHLAEYKKYITENADCNKKVPGYDRTARELKIKRERANMLRQYLIDDGYLKCEGKYTYLNK